MTPDFSWALTGHPLWWIAIGCLWGWVISRSIAGLEPAATMALALPLLTTLDAPHALMLLVGTYMGAQPTRPAPSATDHRALVSQGRSSTARALASGSALLAGAAGLTVVWAAAPWLSAWTHGLQGGGLFGLMVLGLTAAVAFVSQSLLKGLAMTMLGVLLAHFGNLQLLQWAGHSGVEKVSSQTVLMALILGLVGVASLLDRSERRAGPARPREERPEPNSWPRRQEWREAAQALWRGSASGVVVGLWHGAASSLSAFLAYQTEKKIQPRRDETPFGRGNVRGLVAAQSAHHAAVQSSFVPLLALGIPHNATMALLAGALSLKNMSPGTALFLMDSGSASLAASVILTLGVSLVLMQALRWLPWRVLKPGRLMPLRHAALPMLVAWSCWSMHALDPHWGIYLVAFFTAAGYLLRKLACPIAPLLLGFVMGPALEAQLRSALLMSQGDWSAVITQPLCAGLLLCALLLLAVAALPWVHKRCDEIVSEE